MKIVPLVLFFLITFNVNATPFKNTLQNHASPYLALHGSDPVKWQEWNKKTIDRAKREGKLLYVSSGYFSCHWCHVMQRESYKNQSVAKILNKYFIPVKVDREINSALDSHLIDFVERTQGRAGWPLNVFITPEGYPLVGMTYVPTVNFIQILNNLKTKWKEEKKQLQEIAKSASEELSKPTIEVSEKISEGLAIEFVKQFLNQADAMKDDMSGGFGQQNKFPSYPQLNAMLTMYESKPNKELKQFLELTLNKMATQGLYDQLGHGFFRYTVDPIWQVPHFEKMLYDNALLATLYVDASRILKNKNYKKIAMNTLDFMMKVFRSDQGAYIASLSALDNKGIEGGYYLWQRDEIKSLLNKNELKVTELIWQLEGSSDIEGGHHLVEIMTVSEAAEMLRISKDKANKYFSSAKEKMIKVRNDRVIPRDTKLLAAWNGLALTAFSKAAKAFNNKKYLTAAKDIRYYIYDDLWINNALIRAVKGNNVLAQGGLEDYAYVVQGIQQWMRVSPNKEDEVWLNKLISQAWHRYHTKKGWLLSENSLLKYGEGELVISDGVLPSPSAVLIRASLIVANKNNNTELKMKSLKALNTAHQDIMSQPFWYASQIVTLFGHQNNSK